MSVILEFAIEKEAFSLGQVLSGVPSMHIELERIVPTANTVMPFLWVTGDDFERFEQNVSDHEFVDEIRTLDRVEDSTLYRITWHGSHNDLIQGITEVDGTVLEGHADDRWYFRIRFSDHDALSRFYNFCTVHELAIHIVRTYTESSHSESVNQFDLSQEQREALILGLQRGHFDTPSQASMSELAEELGISQQAFSNRIRRGIKKVLSEALLSSTTDFE